jgi:DNA-binding LytR/AlgR family response regulator
MPKQIKILVVEDEMIIGANISLQLNKLGYEVSGIVPKGEDALQSIKENQPDIVLLDINLKGKLDGIETAILMQKDYNIPVIYLTANADDDHFNKAKATNPYAFISKPFKKLDLQHAIELTIGRIMANENLDNGSLKNKVIPFVLTDCVFVKHHDKMLKISIKDIYYIEAERNYCRIFSKDREFLLVMTLKDIDEKLPLNHFIRIHRSYIVNLSHIDEVAGSYVLVSKKAIPITKGYRTELLKRLQTI